jgi:lipopolysaccharide/colanic/teichoic acid biosynthesis glycosyltransferase
MSVLTAEAQSHLFDQPRHLAVVAQPVQWGAKRALDMVTALLLMVVTLPVVLAAIVAIVIDTRGNPFFSQIRIGADGRPFRLHKLRTMVVHTSDESHRAYIRSLRSGRGRAEGGLFKLVDDPRITRVGRILRRWSIDEIPQLWNVLRGDMSVVGPRPPLPYEATEWQDQAWMDLGVRPGLTGLWQISGRATLPYECRAELDGQYCERWSLGLDLAIMARTPMAILAGRGAG